MGIELNGKVAIITGAARGIGKGMATALGKAGAAVTITDIRKETLDQTSAEFDALYNECVGKYEKSAAKTAGGDKPAAAKTAAKPATKPAAKTAAKPAAKTAGGKAKGSKSK